MVRKKEPPTRLLTVIWNLAGIEANISSDGLTDNSIKRRFDKETAPERAMRASRRLEMI